MEFLDDLRQQRESKTQPKAQPEAQSLTSARPTPKLSQDPEVWDQLLASVTVDEPIEVPTSAPESNGKGRVRARKQGLTVAQKIILGTLIIAVLAIWAGVILFITGTFRTKNIDLNAEVDAASEAEGLIRADVEEATIAPPVASRPEVAVATETPLPTDAPIPVGPIATIYDEQLRRDPDNAGLYLQRGHAYLEGKAYEAALGDFQRAEQLGAGATAYEGLGRVYYVLFQWRDAETAFNEATALDSDLADAHFGLGQIAYYRGDYRKAAKAFDTAAEIDPQRAEYEAWLAIAAAHFNDRPEALGAASRAVSLLADSSLVYVAKSWAARVPDREASNARDLDGAQGDLLHAMDLGPNDFLTLNAVAEFYVAERPERLAEAEQLAAYALNWARNDVERAVAMQTLGRVYLLQERKADAQHILGQAAALASVDGEIALAGLEEDLARAHE
ncbi:MAG: tetratricopeptide repeat protein [Anaerolineae bacterium]|jgi:tetratricopeptide (TPR) repeat protein|nr:tetratricopeptide repeat protein [Anaerolineae bacterium]